jgi:hypothetical protein
MLTHDTAADVQRARDNERKALSYVALAIIVAALLTGVELYIINDFVNTQFGHFIHDIMTSSSSAPRRTAR